MTPSDLNSLIETINKLIRQTINKDADNISEENYENIKILQTMRSVLKDNIHIWDEPTDK